MAKRSIFALMMAMLVAHRRVRLLLSGAPPTETLLTAARRAARGRRGQRVGQPRRAARSRRHARRASRGRAAQGPRQRRGPGASARQARRRRDAPRTKARGADPRPHGDPRGRPTPATAAAPADATPAVDAGVPGRAGPDRAARAARPGLRRLPLAAGRAGRVRHQTWPTRSASTARRARPNDDGLACSLLAGRPGAAGVHAGRREAAAAPAAARAAAPDDADDGAAARTRSSTTSASPPRRLRSTSRSTSSSSTPAGKLPNMIEFFLGLGPRFPTDKIVDVWRRRMLPVLSVGAALDRAADRSRATSRTVADGLHAGVDHRR